MLSRRSLVGPKLDTETGVVVVAVAARTSRSQMEESKHSCDASAKTAAAAAAAKTHASSARVSDTIEAFEAKKLIGPANATPRTGKARAKCIPSSASPKGCLCERVALCASLSSLEKSPSSSTSSASSAGSSPSGRSSTGAPLAAERPAPDSATALRRQRWRQRLNKDVAERRAPPESAASFVNVKRGGLPPPLECACGRRAQQLRPPATEGPPALEIARQRCVADAQTGRSPGLAGAINKCTSCSNPPSGLVGVLKCDGCCGEGTKCHSNVAVADAEQTILIVRRRPTDLGDCDAADCSGFNDDDDDDDDDDDWRHANLVPAADLLARPTTAPDKPAQVCAVVLGCGSRATTTPPDDKAQAPRLTAAERTRRSSIDFRQVQSCSSCSSPLSVPLSLNRCDEWCVARAVTSRRQASCVDDDHDDDDHYRGPDLDHRTIRRTTATTALGDDQQPAEQRNQTAATVATVATLEQAQTETQQAATQTQTRIQTQTKTQPHKQTQPKARTLLHCPNRLRTCGPSTVLVAQRPLDAAEFGAAHLSWTDIGARRLVSEPQSDCDGGEPHMGSGMAQQAPTKGSADATGAKDTTGAATTIPIMGPNDDEADKESAANNGNNDHDQDHDRAHCCRRRNSDGRSGGADSPTARRGSGGACLAASPLVSKLAKVFPILSSCDAYSLPEDLLTDFVAGFTMAVLHIPQGMAYGLLAGVEPIYGLYVSFVPVLVMALMSRSRHVSYGSFAIISILLMNACDSIKTSLFEEYAIATASGGAGAGANGSPAGRSENDTPPNDADDDSFRMSFVERDSNDTYVDLDAIVSETILRDGFVMPTNIEILGSVCLVCGLIHILMSLARLGALSLIFSDQLVSSFTTASAMHVLTSQLSGLIDLKLPHVSGDLFAIFRTWWLFGERVYAQLADYYLNSQEHRYNGRFNPYTALLSLVSILYLLLIKELVEPLIRRRFKKFTCLPSELTLMILTILASSYFNFSQNYEIKIVGQVPSGLPAPKLPRVDYLGFVWQDALTVALVSFALNISLAQMCAKKFRYKLNSNQELFALGSANLVSSCFSSYPCGSSLSRTAVQTQLNNKSQLASIISCLFVIVIICYFAHILHDLPRSTLCCIIVVALKGILKQCQDLKTEWYGSSKLNALVWLCTFVSVLLFGVTYGLVLGVLGSLLILFYRLLRPKYAVLGQLQGTNIFLDLNAFVDRCVEIERVKMFRYTSPICYLNKTMLRSCLKQAFPTLFASGPPQSYGALDDARKCTIGRKCTNVIRRTMSRCCSGAGCCFGKRRPADDVQKGEKAEPDPAAGGGKRSPQSGGAGACSKLTPGAADSKRSEYLIIDCSAISYCDQSGASALVELIDELDEPRAGQSGRVQVYLVSCSCSLVRMIETCLQRPELLATNVFPSILDALGHINHEK